MQIKHQTSHMAHQVVEMYRTQEISMETLLTDQTILYQNPLSIQMVLHQFNNNQNYKTQFTRLVKVNNL